MTKHKHAAVLRAIADGKEVQCKWNRRDWASYSALNPISNRELEWRVKPVYAAPPAQPAPSAPGWIKCSERMPELFGGYSRACLIVNVVGGISISAYDSFAKYWTDEESGHEVTHWMPLPPSPIAAAPQGEKA